MTDDERYDLDIAKADAAWRKAARNLPDWRTSLMLSVILISLLWPEPFLAAISALIN